MAAHLMSLKEVFKRRQSDREELQSGLVIWLVFDPL